MARLAKLNWDSTRNKWKVVYKGRKYRFDGGTGKSDREARKRADVEWKRLRAQIDHESELAKPHRAEYESVIAEWTSVMTWSVDHGDDTMAEVARDKLKDLKERLDQRTPPPLGWADRFFPGSKPLVEKNKMMEPVYLAAGMMPVIEVEGPYEDDPVWKDRLASQERRLQLTGCDDTFAANVQQFLAEKRAEAAAGQISLGRVDGIRAHLDLLMEFTGSTTSVKNIDHASVSAFRNHLLQRIAGKQISESYAKDVLATFRQFIRWLANNTDKLETLPKNLDDRRLAISVSQQKAKTLDTAQITKLLSAASNRTRLYLLLGLNCAMTQQDIADLQPSEVDWTAGKITRKRSKTSDVGSVPEVTYRMWPMTFALLKSERSEATDRVLLTQDGRPLKTETISESSKFQKTDAVRLALRRLSEKTGIEFTMKMLKKTSASLLRNNRHYSGIESLFLDHAPTSMAQKHYTSIPQDLLDEAIAWLGKELGTVE